MSTQHGLDSSQDMPSSPVLDEPGSLDNKIRTAARLRTILDDSHDEDARRDTGLQGDGDPMTTLSKLLHLRSTCSPEESSFGTAHKNMVSMPSPPFRKIGFGQCGLVFEQLGRGFVLKVARQHFEDALQNDLVCHLNAYSAFQKYPCECQIPHVYKYISKEDMLWWSENRPLFGHQAQEGFSLPQMALMTQQILPLPRSARHALIDLYCPPSLRQAAKSSQVNQDCIARVYLGRRSDPRTLNAPNFTLRNFNLHLDQMLIHDLPVHRMAEIMGQSLAIVHWAANIDGYDTEFVLGSEGYTTYRDDNIPVIGIPHDLPRSLDTIVNPEINIDFTRRETRLWLIDFNLCNRFEPRQILLAGQADILVEHLVDAFFENDPYCPRPSSCQDGSIDGELWKCFETSYLEQAESITRDKDKGWRALPRKFIGACLERSHTA